ncbi:TlpA family protein disulfide reductase [Pedobacter deserti]|uniref:TlpA family protein disulfide reductase n=1 Tax=Pedobacter deserti TaxID=2817382 RepID=UPI00210C2A97|nr:redoxin family protein [Pedobacter sp. SYSU D00382]
MKRSTSPISQLILGMAVFFSVAGNCAFAQKKDVATKAIVKPGMKAPKSVRITGNIKHIYRRPLQVDTFTFQYYDALTGSSVIIPIEKDSAGNFSTEVPLTRAEKVQLNHSSKTSDGRIRHGGFIEFFFYAKPGDEMNLNYYVSEDFKTRILKFGGQLGDINNQYTAYQDSLGRTDLSSLIDYRRSDPVTKETLPEFVRYLAHRLKAGRAFNEGYFKKGTNDSFVKKQAEFDMSYSVAAQLALILSKLNLYDSTLPAFMAANSIKWDEPDALLNDIYKIFVNNTYMYLKRQPFIDKGDKLVSFPEVAQYLRRERPELPEADRLLLTKMADTSIKATTEEARYFSEKLMKPFFEEYISISDAKAVYDHLKKIPNPFFRDLLLTRFLTEKLEAGDLRAVRPLMADYKTLVKSAPLKAELIARYDALNRSAARQSPAARLQDVKDVAGADMMSEIIKRNPGKVIYVDVWATWCKPCLAEMPNSKLLRSKFKNEGVVFVYLCISSPREDLCKEKIAMHEMDGQNYFLDNVQSAALIRKFEIKGIPRYMVIDKKGEIMHVNAARPGDEGLEKTLRNLL